jgi:hypothetical protein
MDSELYHTLKKDQDLSELSVLDLLGYENLDPVQLRRIFLLLLRDVFSTEENYDNEELKHPPVIYSEKETLKTLDVELDFLYDPEKVGPRPGVYVGLGPINFEKKVIGDDAGFSYDNSTHYFTCLANTILQIRHVSTTPDFSYLLANHTTMSLLASRPFLLSNLPGLGAFEIQQINPVQLFDPDPVKEFKVDVIFKLVFSFSWSVSLEGHRLKSIETSLPFTAGTGMTGFDCPAE